MEPDRAAQAFELFRAELELCRVQAGDSVAVLAPEGRLQGRAETFLHAATSLGARAFGVTVPWHDWGAGTTGTTPLTDLPGVMSALESSDLVIDLVKLLFSDAQLELQAAGCRVLLCVEPYETLARLFPSDEVRFMVEAEERLLREATTLRVTSSSGTDVTYRLGAYGVLTEYGYTDQPGRWDHWPSGFALTHAADDGVDGVVVLRAGDILLLPTPRMIAERIELEIESGYITKIHGDNLDTLILREFFAPAERSDDADAFAVSHIGWGLNPQARWGISSVPGTINQEARAYLGNVLFSTGPNREVGGTRSTPFHLDIPLRGCTVELDETTVVDEGRILLDEKG